MPWVICNALATAVKIGFGYDHTAPRNEACDAEMLSALLWTHSSYTPPDAGYLWVAVGFEDGSYFGYALEGVFDEGIIKEVVDGGKNSSCPEFNLTEWCYTQSVMNTTTLLPEPAHYAYDGYDCRSRGWYQEGMAASEKGEWSSVYAWQVGEVEGQLAFDAVMPLYDKRDKKVGVVDVSFSLQVSGCGWW